MVTKEQKVMSLETIDRQREYVERQKKVGEGLGVVFADAFLRGMRDIGYKSPVWALAEQIDNSFQAAADSVSIRFSHAKGVKKGEERLDQLAVCDNGIGMIPEMISYAVRWGGTDRENDRTGYGRFGYGLPSSAVSLAKRYTVYSKPTGAGWNAVTVDIAALAAAAGDIAKTRELLSARETEVPKWIINGAKSDDTLDLTKLKSGTIIVYEDLDRLNSMRGWKSPIQFESKLLQELGVIYRHLVTDTKICVNGVRTQAVDPLFLMEHGRFYDDNSVRVQRVPTRSFEVDTERGTKGTVSIRASVIPPDFTYEDPSQYSPNDRRGGKKHKGRMETIRQYNGFLVCRAGRQIDCVLPRWVKFQNEDAYIKIEINFDPELDEYFGITTAKQQIMIADDMWEKLQHSGKGGGGLINLVLDMKKDFEKLKKKLDATAETQDGKDQPLASAAAMEETEKFKDTVPEPTPEQKEQGLRNIERLASNISGATGQPKEEVKQKLLEQTSTKKWDIGYEQFQEGPFYIPTRLGEQKLVILNTDHPFYSKVYNASGTSEDVKKAFQVLLFVLSERELETKGDTELFYKAERNRWSQRLRYALDKLMPDESIANKAASVAEKLFMESEVETMKA